MLRDSRIVVLVGLTLLPACPVLDVQADVERACLTYTGVAVDAAPAATSQLTQSFTVDKLDSFQALAQRGFSLELLDGQLQATSGIDSFAFLDHASLALASGAPASTLPSVDAFRCDACGTSGDSIALAAASTADLAPYVSTGTIIVTLDLSGALPAKAWTADVSVCARGSASYQLDP